MQFRQETVNMFKKRLEKFKKSKDFLVDWKSDQSGAIVGASSAEAGKNQVNVLSK